MKLLATILAFLAVVDATPVKRPAFRAGPSIMGPAFTPGTLPGPAPLPDIEARSTPAMTPAKRIASLAKACKDLKLDGYHLQGKCSEDGKGDPVEVKIDLNSRISNDKGMLKFKLNGGFDGSCEKCEMNIDKWEVNMVCQCKQEDGSVKKTDALDLNDGVVFMNGRLQFPKVQEAKKITSAKKQTRIETK